MITLLVITIAVAAFAVGGELFTYHDHSPNMNARPPLGTSAGSSSPAGGSIATRTAVPSDITVANAAATGTSSNLGVPTTVAPGDPSDLSSYRSFTITVSNDAFSPKGIAVYAGDTVRLSLVAEDKPYDFTLPDYGMRVPLPQGRTTNVQFSPSATGKFLFYCTSCGGPESGPTGYLIVVARVR